MARKIFYSFDYEKDLFRVQQIRNMGVLEKNKLVSANRWEEVKKGGDDAIKQWIDDNMRGRSCLIVLVGERTYRRRWVKYEIRKAWKEGLGVLGIYIHNIKCLKNSCGDKGPNPFADLKLGGEPFSSVVKCYNPKAGTAYQTIKDNIETWIETAIEIRQQL